MITAQQLRSARAFFNFGLKDVSEAVGVGIGTISDLEQQKTDNPRSGTIDKLRLFYEANGIEFTAEGGVRPSTAKFRHLTGTDGFQSLMDDVYEQTKEKGGNIRLWNARPHYFIGWLGADFYQNHSERMRSISHPISFFVTCEEGETNFIGSSFAEYRWVPKTIFNEQAIYCYGDRIAFLNFSKDHLNIFILQNQDFYDSFCLLFDFVWNDITTQPTTGK